MHESCCPVNYSKQWHSSSISLYALIICLWATKGTEIELVKVHGMHSLIWHNTQECWRGFIFSVIPPYAAHKQFKQINVNTHSSFAYICCYYSIYHGHGYVSSWGIWKIYCKSAWISTLDMCCTYFLFSHHIGELHAKTINWLCKLLEHYHMICVETCVLTIQPWS